MGLQLKDEVFLKPIAADEIVINAFIAPLCENIAGILEGALQKGPAHRGLNQHA